MDTEVTVKVLKLSRFWEILRFSIPTPHGEEFWMQTSQRLGPSDDSSARVEGFCDSIGDDPVQISDAELVRIKALLLLEAMAYYRNNRVPFLDKEYVEFYT